MIPTHNAAGLLPFLDFGVSVFQRRHRRLCGGRIDLVQQMPQVRFLDQIKAADGAFFGGQAPWVLPATAKRTLFSFTPRRMSSSDIFGVIEKAHRDNLIHDAGKFALDLAAVKLGLPYMALCAFLNNVFQAADKNHGAARRLLHVAH